MNYYFIYSAGGGAGDWNGLDRIWKDSMPVVLKKRILLKFGDVFFNHASLSSPLKPSMLKKVTSVRQWLYENVKDDYVLSESKILLDSGTSKLINTIYTQDNSLTPEEILYRFRGVIEKNGILEKYAEIIVNSNVEEAVTIDAPNPFKIRTQSANTKTNIFNDGHALMHVELNSEYCNKLFGLLGGQKQMLTTFNGLWDSNSLKTFLKGLKYKPSKVAIGGLTRATKSVITEQLRVINKEINLFELERVHFLGCGGIDKATLIKSLGFTSEHFSVDNSTPYNRAIDGGLSGEKQSGYFDYQSKKLFRINPKNKNLILTLHEKAKNKVFSDDQMAEIIDGILKHQSRNSGHDTYNNRAKLVIHNHDVFRQNAL
jgi:hypothetical protein